MYLEHHEDAWHHAMQAKVKAEIEEKLPLLKKEDSLVIQTFHNNLLPIYQRISYLKNLEVDLKKKAESTNFTKEQFDARMSVMKVNFQIRSSIFACLNIYSDFSHHFPFNFICSFSHRYGFPTAYNSTGIELVSLFVISNLTSNLVDIYKNGFKNHDALSLLVLYTLYKAVGVDQLREEAMVCEKKAQETFQEGDPLTEYDRSALESRVKLDQCTGAYLKIQEYLQIK